MVAMKEFEASLHECFTSLFFTLLGKTVPGATASLFMKEYMPHSKLSRRLSSQSQ